MIVNDFFPSFKTFLFSSMSKENQKKKKKKNKKKRKKKKKKKKLETKTVRKKRLNWQLTRA